MKSMPTTDQRVKFQHFLHAGSAGKSKWQMQWVRFTGQMLPFNAMV